MQVADLVAATLGRLVQGTEGAELSGVSTDTRTLARGAAFLALRGEQFDGHGYLVQAAAAGAVALVVERWPLPCPGGLPVVLVDDTTRAYGRLAAWWRARMSARVVGITGSNGKTTTKDMAACLLSALGPTVATEGNHNNHIGVPQTLLRLRPEHRFAIVEMGTNHPGEMDYLAGLVRPDVAVLTNIGPSHLEFFGSEEGVKQEKSALLRYLAPHGLAVLHAAEDDPWSLALAAEHRGRTATFGSAPEAVWRAVGVRSGAASIAFRLRRSPVGFFVPVVGPWQVDNCLAAIAVADELGLNLAQAAVRLRGFVAPDLRMALRRAGGLTLLVDCYNANPASMRGALEELARRPVARRVAVLGDMLEQGAASEAAHEALGERVAASAVDLLCTFGERAARAARSAVRHGLAAESVFSTTDPAAAVAWLCERLRPGDTVLVKGSRSMRLERVADALEAWAAEHLEPTPVASEEELAAAVALPEAAAPGC
jgi:UDP-N-acetylmuramoyl-tripeptide--D-alanyl-D-alanine ligase